MRWLRMVTMLRSRIAVRLMKRRNYKRTRAAFLRALRETLKERGHSGWLGGEAPKRFLGSIFDEYRYVVNLRDLTVRYDRAHRRELDRKVRRFLREVERGGDWASLVRRL